MVTNQSFDNSATFYKGYIGDQHDVNKCDFVVAVTRVGDFII